jgi:hypothetical protein
MTIFDDLRTLHGIWHEARSDFYTKYVFFTRKFVNELKAFLGAPDFFTEFSNANRKRNYVSLVKISPFDENGKYRASDLENYEVYDQHISEEENDGVVFGIKIYIDTAENVWLKHPFLFRISSKPKEGNFEMKVHLVSFQVNIDRAETLIPVYEHIVGEIKRVLERPPGYVSPRNGDNIGFLTLSSEL